MPHPSSRLAQAVFSLGATLGLLVSGCGPESDPGNDGASDAEADVAWPADGPEDAEDLGDSEDSEDLDNGEDREDGEDADDTEEAQTVLPGEVRLRLETRDGRATEGWSLSEGSLVEAEDADLLLSSWDCGARGRWVQLEAQGVDLCHAAPDGGVDVDHCRSSLQVGGSDPEVPLDGEFFVVTPTEVARVVLVDRTDTPFEWYLEEDLSFEVLLHVELDDEL